MSDIVPIEPIQTPAGLEVFDRIVDPMAAVKVLGESIFKSGMFGCTKPEQGEVLAMQCLAEKKSPLEIASSYHFIQGKLCLRSDALLGRFLRAGGKVEWVERSDDKVVAIFEKDGSKVTVTQTLARWKQNGVATGANKGTWEKYPMNMLSARAITEGVRLVGADCCIGVHVAEDIDFSRGRPVPTSILDIVPPGKVDKAVEVLRKAGMLEDGQQISDLSAVDESTILKKPGAFLSALND